MGRFGKPDATGRSSGRVGGREGKVRRPPSGEPWTWLTAELLASEAWRGLSINGHRLMSFLMVEHMNHAGRENGHLRATHEQLKAYGLCGNRVRAAIEECDALGLITYTRGGRWAGTNRPSTYRLTFYADAEGNPATNDWKAASGRMRAKPKTESCSHFIEYRARTSESTDEKSAQAGTAQVIDLTQAANSARTLTSESASISRKTPAERSSPQNLLKSSPEAARRDEKQNLASADYRFSSAIPSKLKERGA